MPIEKNTELLARWKDSLPASVDVGGLFSRSAVSHKWKAPYRSLVIREALMWRMHDLGIQIEELSKQGYFLGARILLRSALETLAIMIYLNQKTHAVVEGNLPFFEFDDVTMKLLMGSRNQSTSQNSINILTILGKANKAHPGLASMHEHLSESAHPNYDGVTYGYSDTNPEEHETVFQNNWARNFSAEQEPATAFVLHAFEHEYNKAWPEAWKSLESWLDNNKAELEEQRNASNN